MNGFRFYHLLFAGGVALAWFTAESLGLVHAWTGYVVAALIGLRLILSALGARGFDLVRLKPRFATAPRGQGGLRHPAIGRLLTLALLAAVATTATTGIFMDKGGTLFSQSIRAKDEERREEREHASARQDDGEEEGESEDEEGLLGEIHETTGNALLPLVSLHALWLLFFRLDLARFVLFLPRRRPA